MFKQRILLLLLIISLILGSGCSKDNPMQPEQQPPIEVNFTSKLGAVVARDNIPSLVAAIIKNDTIAWQGAFGKSDVGKNIDASDRTIYLLASVSKVVVATAVMQLAEQNKIDLDNDINRYIPFSLRNPNFPGDSITTRMLLTHRSGLNNPSSYGTYPGDSAPPLFPGIRDILVPGSARYNSSIWTNNRPGGNFLYSNISTAMLGYLVQTVSNTDFNQYCIQNIFEPLEMADTSFRLAELDEDRLAAAYVNGQAFAPYSLEFYPAGSIKSTLADFSHFLIAYLTGGVYKGKRILQASTIMQMLTVQDSDSPLGLHWYRYSSLNGWGHGGLFHGFSTVVTLQPQHNIGVLIFANSSTLPNNTVFVGGEIYNMVHTEAERYR